MGPVKLLQGYHHKGEKMAKEKAEELKAKTNSKEKEVQDTSASGKTAIAKAGKRSKKSVEEEAVKTVKKIKKAQKQESAVKKPNPRKIKISKNQKAARELIEKDKAYSIEEAIKLLPKTSKVKFDATAELHVVLDIDPKQSDQMLRASTSLPAGTGKTVTVAVIADEKLQAEAKKAGADRVDTDKLLTEIQKGKLNFDVLVANPDKMADLGKLAKVLGPKGLMPSPKNGTVTTDVATAVADIKKGKVELKNDPSGIMHVAFGKLSFKASDLESNLRAVLSALRANKPSGVKGSLIKSVYISSSMGPSIKLDLSETNKK